MSFTEFHHYVTNTRPKLSVEFDDGQNDPKHQFSFNFSIVGWLILAVSFFVDLFTGNSAFLSLFLLGLAVYLVDLYVLGVRSVTYTKIENSVVKEDAAT